MRFDAGLKIINMTEFKNLDLNPKILSALEKKGYTTPTPIQDQAIPHVLAGRDLFGIAQTGTGKTAAFSLPILHNLAKSAHSVKSGCVRVLILTPTRELASQIADNIEIYGKELGLRYAVMFGGVSERPQIAAIQRGVDILIATPGRLLDLTNQGYIRYMQLEVFVLDEADRMLDMGFINDIKKIIQKIPEKRQTLFFSATMPATITDLAHSILRDPVRVEVTPASTTVEKIDQRVLHVERSNKASLLKRILKDEAVTSALVFSKTKHGANKVVEFLEKNGVTVEAIHGNKSQGAREKALGKFRAGEIKVLVATDIAARGIDIPAISHVINYDIPMDPESYVHRIGRTARAGREGIALSLCDPSEVRLLREVEKTIQYKIPVDDTHPFHGVAPAPVSHDFDDSRKRSFGHSPNRDRREGGRPQRRDDSRRSAPHGDRRPRSAEDDRGNRRPARPGDDSRPRFDGRRPEKKTDGPGFFGGISKGIGRIFGKKVDDKKFNPSRNHTGGNRRRDPQDRRDDNFGNRIPPEPKEVNGNRSSRPAPHSRGFGARPSSGGGRPSTGGRRFGGGSPSRSGSGGGRPSRPSKSW